MELIELVKQLINNNISIINVGVKGDGLRYDIQGFAKSGHGGLYQEDGQIKLETRYNQIDNINTLDDIIEVAYDWDLAYRDDYKVEDAWKKLYIKTGRNTILFK